MRQIIGEWLVEGNYDQVPDDPDFEDADELIERIEKALKERALNRIKACEDKTHVE